MLPFSSLSAVNCHVQWVFNTQKKYKNIENYAHCLSVRCLPSEIHSELIDQPQLSPRPKLYIDHRQLNNDQGEVHK